MLREEVLEKLGGAQSPTFCDFSQSNSGSAEGGEENESFRLGVVRRSKQMQAATTRTLGPVDLHLHVGRIGINKNDDDLYGTRIFIVPRGGTDKQVGRVMAVAGWASGQQAVWSAWMGR